MKRWTWMTALLCASLSFAGCDDGDDDDTADMAIGGEGEGG
jgi:hypothetical protein